MSETEIYKLGYNASIIGSTNNSWLGAMSVWAQLSKEYFNLDYFPLFDEEIQQKIWDLQTSKELPFYKKIVLISTLDRIIMKKDDKEMVVNHSAKQFVDGMAHTNGIESVWAILKRGFYGVYHSFSEKHLQRYVNEFTFRLNEGNVKIHTMDRLESLLDNTFGQRLTYKKLIA